MILCVSKLFGNSKKESCSIEILLSKLYDDPSLYNDEKLNEIIIKKRELYSIYEKHIKNYRNDGLAHLDYDSNISFKQTIVFINNFENLLNKIKDFFNSVLNLNHDFIEIDDITKLKYIYSEEIDKIFI